MDSLFSNPQQLTELLSIVKATVPRLDVVFVHGLDGDPITTWRMDKNNSWTTWIKETEPDANVWTLGYRLRSTSWQGGSMHMLTRATNVLATLDAELSGKRPIIFICHSYGGLLVKQMLRTASDIATGYQRLTDRVTAIIFFGTPNSGSPIASFASALKSLLPSSIAVEELQSSAPHLQELNYWFRKRAENNEWELLS
jgi:triacylglycerol esterase/lipase EstA (alpha/beta hydrolase family)